MYHSVHYIIIKDLKYLMLFPLILLPVQHHMYCCIKEKGSINVLTRSNFACSVTPQSALIAPAQSVTFRQLQATSLGTSTPSTPRTTVHPTGIKQA